MFLSLALYILLLAIVSQTTGSKTCSELGEWYTPFKNIVLGASGGAFLAQIARIVVKYHQDASYNTFAAYFTALLVMAIMLATECVPLFQCVEFSKDLLGVESPTSQWAEWQITVPMMFYLNLTLNAEKLKLNLNDIKIIIAAWFSIFAAWIPNLAIVRERTNNRELTGVMFITLSALSFGYAVYFNLHNSQIAYHRLKQKMSLSPTPYDMMVFAVASRNLTCSTFVAYSMPLFPVVYCLRLSQIISFEWHIILNSFLNFGAKVLYVLFITDGHLEVLDPQVFSLLAEKKANESRL